MKRYINKGHLRDHSSGGGRGIRTPEARERQNYKQVHCQQWLISATSLMMFRPTLQDSCQLIVHFFGDPLSTPASFQTISIFAYNYSHELSHLCHLAQLNITAYSP